MLTHGGDLVGFYETYGQTPLDFSVNTNPLGLPKAAKEAAAAALSRAGEYPDPQYRRLREAIGRHYHIPASFIVPGNGAGDLILRIAAAERGRHVLLIAPTFSEYEAALEAFDCRIERHTLTEEQRFDLTEDFPEKISPDLDALFLCNPNNPTGRTINQKLLLRILDKCRACGTLLWIDECFNGFLDCPQKHSLVRLLADYENLVVLQAATKLYAMAGMRLGFAFCAGKNIREKLWAFGQSWSVSIEAQEAGIAALEDGAYLKQSRALIRNERKRMREALASLSVKVLEGEANYLFFKTDIPAFDRHLAEKGFLIRSCASYQGLGNGYYRIAIRMPQDNDRLIRAIFTVYAEHKGSGNGG